jgi:hypothetical protein
MEMYTYRCKECGFVHCVPAYWTSFTKDKEIEITHLNLESKEMCLNEILLIVEE